MNPIHFCALFFFAAFTTLVHAEDKVEFRFASVNIHKIDSLLAKVALAAPEHDELRESYFAKKEKQEERQKMMMEKMQKGEKFNPMEMAQDMAGGHQMRTQVKDLQEKKLLEIIKDLYGDTYQIVLRGSYGQDAIYSRVPIEDITPHIRQYLMKDE